jgi:hypothetical protein
VLAFLGCKNCSLWVKHFTINRILSRQQKKGAREKKKKNHWHLSDRSRAESSKKSLDESDRVEKLHRSILSYSNRGLIDRSIGWFGLVWLVGVRRRHFNSKKGRMPSLNSVKGAPSQSLESCCDCICQYRAIIIIQMGNDANDDMIVGSTIPHVRIAQPTLPSGIADETA